MLHQNQREIRNPESQVGHLCPNAIFWIEYTNHSLVGQCRQKSNPQAFPKWAGGRMPPTIKLGHQMAIPSGVATPPQEFQDFLSLEHIRGEDVAYPLEFSSMQWSSSKSMNYSQELKSTYTAVSLLCYGQALGTGIDKTKRKQNKNINSLCRKLS